MEKSCFAVGLCCVSRVIGLTASLSATMQSRNFDLAQCIQHVDRVLNEAKAMRNDALSGFSSLFDKAQEMATTVVCEIRAPRQCGRRVSRDSYGTSDPQTLSIVRIYNLPIFPYTRASGSISQTSKRIVQLQRLATALHCRGKNRRRIDLQHAPRQLPGGFFDCFGGHVQIRAADVEEILGRKKPGGTIPQLYRKLELLQCSHFPSVFTAINILACIPVTIVA